MNPRTSGAGGDSRLRAAPVTAGVDRPSLALFGSEPLRAAVDALGHLRFWETTTAPRSEGAHTVILFPGLAADGLSLWPLRRHLRGLGYRAIDWGQGFNTGPRGNLDAWLTRLTTRVLKRANAKSTAGDGTPGPGSLSLVGWSLGGLYAREIAKLVPQSVNRVVTIGTPFNGRRDQTNVDWLFRMLNDQAPPDTPRLRARLAVPPPVPTTAIYSRSDGVVAWQACRHGPRYAGIARDIEVSTSHLGMGWSRSVMNTVAHELALAAPTDSEPAAACSRRR